MAPAPRGGEGGPEGDQFMRWGRVGGGDGAGSDDGEAGRGLELPPLRGGPPSGPLPALPIRASLPATPSRVAPLAPSLMEGIRGPAPSFAAPNVGAHIRRSQVPVTCRYSMYRVEPATQESASSTPSVLADRPPTRFPYERSVSFAGPSAAGVASSTFPQTPPRRVASASNRVLSREIFDPSSASSSSPRRRSAIPVPRVPSSSVPVSARYSRGLTTWNFPVGYFARAAAQSPEIYHPTGRLPDRMAPTPAPRAVHTLPPTRRTAPVPFSSGFRATNTTRALDSSSGSTSAGPATDAPIFGASFMYSAMEASDSRAHQPYSSTYRAQASSSRGPTAFLSTYSSSSDISISISPSPPPRTASSEGNPTHPRVTRRSRIRNFFRRMFSSTGRDSSPDTPSITTALAMAIPVASLMAPVAPRAMHVHGCRR